MTKRPNAKRNRRDKNHACCMFDFWMRTIRPAVLPRNSSCPKTYYSLTRENDPRLGRPYARGPDHVLFRALEEIVASGSLSRAICIHRCFLSCARDRRVSSDSCFTSTLLSIEILFYDIIATWFLQDIFALLCKEPARLPTCRLFPPTWTPLFHGSVFHAHACVRDLILKIISIHAQILEGRPLFRFPV